MNRRLIINLVKISGHNGAGKTTSMNMLAGMVSCDVGKCMVGDLDVRKNIEKARKTLGLCTQLAGN